MELDKELLDILFCPRCKGNVRLNAAGVGIICGRCKLQYEVKDGIPIMLADEAKPIEEDGHSSN
ncbi:MAG: Trm112 family protein [Deltaproteobacteria bacterium]|nr:Trm112 family protein [Deltaproteobacteria bacterium]